MSADPKRIISIGHFHKICDDDKNSIDQAPRKLGMLNCLLQFFMCTLKFSCKILYFDVSLQISVQHQMQLPMLRSLMLT